MNFFTINNYTKNILRNNKYNDLKNIYSQYVNHYITSEDAYIVKAFPMPFLFPEKKYKDIIKNFDLVFSAQLKILGHLLREKSKKEILKKLSVPENLNSLIDWENILDKKRYHGRIDFLLSKNGYKFCEFNIESAFGGSELFNIADIFNKIFGLKLSNTKNYLSPYNVLAKNLSKVCYLNNIKKIVILVGDDNHKQGYFKFNDLERYISLQSQGIEVVKKSISEIKEFDRNTLFYRLFMDEEIPCNSQILQTLKEKGCIIINLFDCYVLSSKKWFALLHEEKYFHLISKEEKKAIKNYIPFTSTLSEKKLMECLKNKDKYVFKHSVSYGGKLVLVGKELEANKIIEVIKKKFSDWIVQDYFETDSINFPENLDGDYKKYNLVFGIFFSMQNYSGVLVRGSINKKVVNLTSGSSKIGWGIVLNKKEMNSLKLQIAKEEICE